MDHDNPQDQAPAPDNVITFPAPAPSQTDTTTPQDARASTHTRKARTKGEKTQKPKDTGKAKGKKKKDPSPELPPIAPHTVKPKSGPRGAGGPRNQRITNKQEAFVRAMMECDSAAEAYRRVYNAKNMKPHTCHRQAHELLKNHNVTALLTQLKRERDEKTTLSRAWVLTRLMEHAEVCLGKRTVKLKKATRDGDTVEIETTALDQSAGNRALELLGKEAGMFIDRRETGGPGDFARMGDDELREYVAREMEQAEQMRKGTGTDG